MSNYYFNPLKAYLDEIGQYDLLTGEQELALARIYQNPALSEDERNAARDQLINSNLRLVVSIAKTYHNDNFSLLDLISEGNQGLLVAADKFNPDLGYRFSTCATPWIRQAITKSIMDNGRSIRIPAHIYQLISKYKNLKMEREARQLPVDNSTMAALLRVDEDKITLIQQNMYDALSLDRKLSDDDNDSDTVCDLVSDTNMHSASENAAIQENHELLYDAIAQLDPRTRTIIEMRYGLNGYEPSTLEVIGASVGLTRERVRQIEKTALVKLKTILNENFFIANED